MKFVVMAGGKGQRANCPEKYIQKVLLKDINGKSLIENILDQHRLYSKSQSVRLLTGFLHDDVQREVQNYRKKYSEKTIELKFNKDFEKGILNSVENGLRDINEPVVIVNGDTHYADQVFKVLDDISESTLVVLPKSKEYEDCVKVLSDGNNIKRLGKNLEEYTHISVGALYLKKEHLEIVKSILPDIVLDRDYKPKIWHNLVNELIDRGERVDITEISTQNHYEIDTEEDYDNFLHQKV